MGWNGWFGESKGGFLVYLCKRIAHRSGVQKKVSKSCVFLGSLILLLVWVVWSNSWKRESYVVFAGERGGGYYDFAKGLVSLSEYGGLEVRVKESEGSIANVRALQSGEADFGLVQQGVEVSDEVRAVAALYPDVVHLLVRSDGGIESVNDLIGKRVSLGCAFERDALSF